MKINPVHALLEVLRQQQARAEVQNLAKLKPQQALDQLLAETRNTQFRLEMLEKLVGDRLELRSGDAPPRVAAGERIGNHEKPMPANMASSSAADAMNQTKPQSHGRAWHGRSDMWSNSDAEFPKYQVLEPGQKMPESPVGIAQRFTPTVEDIESALFKEDAEPAEFARVFMARAPLSDEATANQVLGARLVPIIIGAMMLLVVAYLIF